MKEIYVAIFLLSTILFLSLSQKPIQETEHGKFTLIVSTLGKTDQFTLITEYNLQHYLEQHYRIKTANALLTCLDDTCTKQNIGWSLYINNKKTLYSIKNYNPKKGDIIELKYGEIK